MFTILRSSRQVDFARKKSTAEGSLSTFKIFGERPLKPRRKDVQRDMKRLDLSWKEMERRAQHRDSWKLLACGLYPAKGEGH